MARQNAASKRKVSSSGDNTNQRANAKVGPPHAPSMYGLQGKLLLPWKHAANYGQAVRSTREGQRIRARLAGV